MAARRDRSASLGMNSGRGFALSCSTHLVRPATLVQTGAPVQGDSEVRNPRLHT
jgi:hypothetical protein